MIITNQKRPERGTRATHAVKDFLKLEIDDSCLFFDEEDIMRRNLSNIHQYCRRHDLGVRPSSRKLENGWGIWKIQKT